MELNAFDPKVPEAQIVKKLSILKKQVCIFSYRPYSYSLGFTAGKVSKGDFILANEIKKVA